MRDILAELNEKEYIIHPSENYDIGFCKLNEVRKLVEFIDKHWHRNHIFVLSRELLDWQHLDTENNRYNFVVAKNKKTGDFDAILGFVPSSQFDRDIEDVLIWPCIWKVRTDVEVKGLGVSLYHFLKENIQIETIAILGISEQALSIYKSWGFITGKMEHYFIVNDLIKKYNLISCDVLDLNNFKIDLQIYENDICIREYQLSQFEKIPETFFRDTSKYKSKKYYINRYYKHPIYKYLFLVILKKNEPKGIYIARECGINGAKCLRIVDFIGSLTQTVGTKECVRQILISGNYEYIDFMLSDGNNSNLLEAGFLNKRDFNLVIPNYFEPFLLENIFLDWAVKTVGDELENLFFKADADQDRPNLLR